MRVFILFLVALAAYLVGTINPSYLISRLKKFDIREAGSGNAGGSNALITMGKKVGVACMIFDIVKAFAVVRISMVALPDEPIAGAVATTAVILGHIFPVWMGFKGGKGLACLGGSLLAYSPAIAMIFLGVELILVFIVNYICVVPITASVVFPIVYYIRGGSLLGTAIIFIAAFAMLYKHRENIERIKLGTEVHFSYLWRKDKEQARILKNIGAEEFEKLQIKLKIKKDSDK